MNNGLDALAARIAADLTNPTLPSNQLKRPAKRSCLVCAATYVSRVSILCDRGYCSDACADAGRRLADRLESELNSPEYQRFLAAFSPKDE
jgi:hypothetical protein